MPQEKFRVFTEIQSNEKYIVNMVTNAHLTLEEACNLLNEQDKKIQQIKHIMDDELEKAFDNRIKHDEDNALEYFKGYHWGVGNLKKKINEVLLK